MPRVGHRAAAFVLAAVIGWPVLLAQAAVLSTRAIVDTASLAPSDPVRLQAQLARADVQAELIRQGLGPEQALRRVAALSDPEAAELSRQLDAQPAGAHAMVAAVLIGLAALVVGWRQRQGHACPAALIRRC